MKALRVISYILILLVVILGVSFAVANDASVTLQYFLGTLKLPLSLLLVYTLGLGIILGFLANLAALWKARRRYHILQQELKK